MWNDALPRNGITNWSVFYAQASGTTTNGWLTWMKPAGCSWIYIFVIGSGGGGARIANGATTIGAGGGASGSLSRLLIPASVLPDILYVRPGIGGPGQNVANNAGGGGTQCYVSIAPNTTAQNLIFVALGANGGNATTGAGGAGANAITSASGIWMNVGLFTSIAGQAGGAGAGAVDTVGNGVAFGASGIPVTGGAGGGNGTGRGGTVTNGGSTYFASQSGGTGSVGGNGVDGFQLGLNFAPGWKGAPLIFTGGTGGGGHSTGAAGRGGNGAYGCGGGGGGACSGAGTSGNGGNGGDALILIGAF